MKHRLFVYGTLAPGRPNAHLLEAIGGAFEPGRVRGRLKQCGWGAARGYPAIVLDEAGEPVPGYVFSSPQLAAHWEALDRFEGSEYRRVLTRVERDDGRTVSAFIYVLRED